MKPTQTETAPTVGELTTLSAPAMACEFRVQFPADQPDRRFALEAFNWIEALEQQLSVYREDSEVSALNRTAAEGPVLVDARLFRLLKKCRAWRTESDGAFDVAAGALIKAWGFYKRSGADPSEEALNAALACMGMDKIAFDDSKQTVQFQVPGVEINLGAIGKGYALDSVGARLKRVGYRELLLGAGASSILAVGRPPWDDAWLVDLRHPLDRNCPVALIRLKDAGLSSSGVAEQFFEDGGKRYGHILDPRTGRSAEGMLQATAVAGSAADAEALSTAFFINGVEWTENYCRRHGEVGALLFPEPSAGGELQMVVFGRMHELLVLPEHRG